MPADFTQMNGIDNSVVIAGVEIDGAMMLDPGVRDLGDSEVTFGPVTGTGTFRC